MKYIKKRDLILEELEWMSDTLRIDDIINKLSSWDENPDYIEDGSEEPDMDSLLDPYGGYEHQSYIQYVDASTIVYWEGWSKLCWKGAYKKPIYKGKSKEYILKHIEEVRFPIIADEVGMKVADFEYWFEESWTDGVDSGYIMKVTMTK